MRGKRKKKHNGHKLTRETGGTSRSYAEEKMTNPRLKALILEVVENQIREDDPPETRQTFERLLAAGHVRQEAVEMIASALVEEIWAILHDHKPFDRARFAALLKQLG